MSNLMYGLFYPGFVLAIDIEINVMLIKLMFKPFYAIT